MNCWIFLKGIDVNIMMMFLLWWFHWREGSGDHLDNCFTFTFFFFLGFLSWLGFFHICTLHQQCHNFRARGKSLMHSESESESQLFEIEVFFFFFLSSSFMFKIGIHKAG